jgi:septum formation protein
MTMKLVLASASPRRRSLLKLLDLEFEVADADIDERILDNEDPAQMTLRLAQLKASTVYRQGLPEMRVLGGDTAVALDNAVLGKPRDREEAILMLKMLSGVTHCVYSAVALAQSSGCTTLLCKSRVTFRTLDERTILQYCDTSDPYDKAGAYGIQGPAGSFVARLEGSYSGVMGLPLWHTHQLLFGPNPD